MGRLFSESSANTESSRTTSTSTETTKAIEATDEQKPLTTTAARRTEVRGSMIIHHDADEELELVEMESTEDSIDVSKDNLEQRFPVEIRPQPLNEILEVEEEEDEVVTVLKTPRPEPLQAKPKLPAQELLESPLAAKSHFPPNNEDLDLDGSDKENIPASRLKIPVTERPSDRSDSYVTAMTSVAADEPAIAKEPDVRNETPAPIERHIEETREAETIIETQVPVATSPPEHQMQLPSLPTRAPLNMKKSFGVRKSQATSLMESIAGRASIILNRKTFLPSTQPVEQLSAADFKPIEPKPAAVEPQLIATPVEEHSDMFTRDDPTGVKKEKDDTITIIDTELHLGDERLKSKFTTQSQRIHDALNSLLTKSTPGQLLRDAQERIVEAETPAPVRREDGQSIDAEEEEDWIPGKDYSSLAERLTNGQVTLQIDVMQDVISTGIKTVSEQIRTAETCRPPVVEIPQPRPSVVKSAIMPTPPSTASGLFEKFENAAAKAEGVIRNAIAMVTHPTPEPTTHQLTHTPPPKEKPSHLYPDPTESNENFTIHYDDRTSLDSRRDSTYFAQSEAPSQRSQVHIDPPQLVQPPAQEAPPTHAAMPPPRKEPVPAPKPKPVPVSIRVPTASQRQKEQQKKALANGTGIYPTLAQSRSVPDLASPGKLAREESRMSTASVQSAGAYIRGGGQIKALNAAKLAKQRVCLYSWSQLTG